MKPIFVEVPIVCYASNSEKEENPLVKLGLQDESQVEVDTITKLGFIDINKIEAFYPKEGNTSTIVELGSDMYVLEITCKELLNLIEYNLNLV